MNRYILVPDDVTTLNPITGKPQLIAQPLPPNSPEGTQPVGAIEITSFTKWARMLCAFLMRDSTDPYALLDFMAKLAGPFGTKVEPGTVVCLDDADANYARIVTLMKAPVALFGSDNMAVCILTYEPFVRAFMDSTTTAPVASAAALSVPVPVPVSQDVAAA